MALFHSAFGPDTDIDPVILSKKFIHNGVQGFMEILLVFIATKEKSKKKLQFLFLSKPV